MARHKVFNSLWKWWLLASRFMWVAAVNNLVSWLQHAVSESHHKPIERNQKQAVNAARRVRWFAHSATNCIGRSVQDVLMTMRRQCDKAVCCHDGDDLTYPIARPHLLIPFRRWPTSEQAAYSIHQLWTVNLDCGSEPRIFRINIAREASCHPNYSVLKWSIRYIVNKLILQ